MKEKPNNVCYDLKKCYITSLCKYMFKKCAKKTKFAQCWKTNLKMSNEWFGTFYPH
jgi:hypothetical protein